MADKEYVLDDADIEREVISRKEAKEKGLKYFFTGDKCRHGHVVERRVSNGCCLECERETGRQKYKRNKEKILEYSKRRYEENREEILEREKKRREELGDVYRKQRREYRNKNREKDLERQNQYYYANREILLKQKRQKYATDESYRERLENWRKNNLDKINERKRERYKTDLSYKTKTICRDLVRRVLLLTKQEKREKTHEALGYSSEDLREHISSLFLDGMSWDNYGEWHIDHIYPVQRLLDEGVADVEIINRLDNLAPMWACHNMEKKDKTIEEYLQMRPELRDLYGNLTK